MFNLNDDIIMDKIDKGIKIVCVVIALVIVIFSMKDSMVEGPKKIEKNLQLSEELEQKIVVFSEKEESFSALDITYQALVKIAKEKKYNLATKTQFEEILTAEEKAKVEEIANLYQFDGYSTEEVVSSFGDKKAMIDYYGVENLQVLYDIVNNHKKDLAVSQ